MEDSAVIKRIHHSGVWVSDIYKILPFYRDFLDMKIVLNPEVMSGPIVDTLTGIPGAKVKAVILKKGGQSWEFLQLVSPPGKPYPPDVPYAEVGRGHICFEVENIYKAYQELEGKGIKFICPPQEFPELKMFYFEDPGGNRIEFVELHQATEHTGHFGLGDG